jgi:hypothetical protein
MPTNLPHNTRVANLFFQLRVGSDANLFGRMIYGLFHVWGVTGLPPLQNPPKNLTQISKVPRGYGFDFGRQVYGMLMSKVKDKDKVEEILSEFLTVRIMDKQHKLADRFKGKALDEAQKIVATALKNFLVDTRRHDKSRDKEDLNLVNEETGEILDTPDGADSLDEILPPGELNQVVREVQRLLAPKNPDIARDIPLYFDFLMDGTPDSKIIGNKMLPFLQDRPMSPQAWSKGYKDVIKNVLDKHLSRQASASSATLSRVANLVSATEPEVKVAIQESTMKILNYDAQITTLQSSFTGYAAERMYEHLQSAHRSLSSNPKFENVLGFENWDYGSPRQQGDVWSCRVWIKSGSFIQMANGETSEGNLLIKIQFGTQVQVDLVLDNRDTIFSKTFSTTSASPSTVGTYCADAWVKALTGRS